MKKSVLAAAIVLAGVPAFAEIDPIVITYESSRLGLTNETTGRSIEVFDQRDIQTGAYTSLVDVIEKAAGVSLAYGTVKSQNGQVRIRNANQSRVLVILNGMPLRDGTNNYPDLSRIALASVSRIEVIKGNVAAQYGRRATGGVVFIETVPESETAFIEGSVGSFNTWAVKAGASQGREHGVLSVQVSKTQSDGFDTTTASTNPDKDGFNEQSVQIGYRGEIKDKLAYQVTANKENGENQYDNGVVANDNHSISLQVEVFNSLGTATASASIADYEADFTGGFAYQSKFQGKRVELTQSLPVLDQSLIGIEWLEENNFGSSFEEDLIARDLSLFAETTMTIGDASVSGALRTNDSNQYGRDLSWLVSAIGTTGSVRPFLNIGQAELKPSPLQLNGYVSPDGTNIPGNSSLTPETSSDLEIGLAMTSGQFESRVALFGSEIEDQIKNGSNGVAATNTDGKLDRYGFEAQATFSIGRVAHSASVTRAVTETAEGAQQLQFPEYTAQYSLATRFGQTFSELSFDYESDRANFNATEFNNERVLTSLRVSRSIADWDLSAKIDNLFDEIWEPTPTYRGTARSFNLVARYSF